MRMRGLGVLGGIAVVALSLGTASVRAEEAASDTITGEVVDLSCYLPHKETRSAGHKKCAETCAKKGLPMGIATADKTVYLLLENHDNPKAYGEAIGKAAQTVTVEGHKVNDGGVNGFVVEAVK